MRITFRLLSLSIVSNLDSPTLRRLPRSTSAMTSRVSDPLDRIYAQLYHELFGPPPSPNPGRDEFAVPASAPSPKSACALLTLLKGNGAHQS